MSYDQLVSDPLTYVKKRTQRPDDSILLRHVKTKSVFDGCGGCCAKEGGTYYFWGLEDHHDKQEVRGEKQYRARRTLVESLLVGKLETDCKPLQTLTVMESRHAIRQSTAIHTSAQLHNRKQTRSEPVASKSQRYTQHLSSSRTTHDISKRND